MRTATIIALSSAAMARNNSPVIKSKWQYAVAECDFYSPDGKEMGYAILDQDAHQDKTGKITKMFNTQSQAFIHNLEASSEYKFYLRDYHWLGQKECTSNKNGKGYDKEAFDTNGDGIVGEGDDLFNPDLIKGKNDARSVITDIARENMACPAKRNIQGLDLECKNCNEKQGKTTCGAGPIIRQLKDDEETFTTTAHGTKKLHNWAWLDEERTQSFDLFDPVDGEIGRDLTVEKAG